MILGKAHNTVSATQIGNIVEGNRLDLVNKRFLALAAKIARMDI
jgi:hypothetical protein